MSISTQTRNESYLNLEGLGQKQAEVLEIIRKHGPIADYKIARLLNWPINRVTPRRNELWQEGLIREAGTEFNQETQRNATRWNIAPAKPQEDEPPLARPARKEPQAPQQTSLFDDAATTLEECDYLIVSDGGTKPTNPGNGYGSYLLQKQRGKPKGEIHRKTFGPNITNNQAEYLALIAGLKDLVSRIRKAGAMGTDYTVHVRSDSQIMVYQLSGKYGVGDEKLYMLWEQATSYLKIFQSYRLEWVKREEIVKVLGH